MTPERAAEVRALAASALPAEEAERPTGEFSEEGHTLLVGFRGGPAEMYPALAAMHRLREAVAPSAVLDLLDEIDVLRGAGLAREANR